MKTVPFLSSLLLLAFAAISGSQAFAQSARLPTAPARPALPVAAAPLPPNVAIPFRLKVVPTQRHPSELLRERSVPLRLR